MDQRREHVATLCAVGTLGVAAAGFALAEQDGQLQTISVRKRKAPGADVSYSPILTTDSIPRSVSQPITPQPRISSQPVQQSITSSLFRRKTLRDLDRSSNGDSTLTESRGSSLSRRGILRSRTTTARDTSTERDESRPRSSWLRRLSTMSSLNDSSPAPSILKDEPDLDVSKMRQMDSSMPNKLVKRSTSQRVLSLDHARGTIFRRPATSHQRTLSGNPALLPHTPVNQLMTESRDRPQTSTMETWRPFFNSGHSRKRHTSGNARDVSIRTVSASYAPRPTLVHGKAVQRPQFDDSGDERVPKSMPSAPTSVAGRKKRRPSLGTFGRGERQRNFTDPTTRVFKEDARGSILPSTRQSPLSPVSRSSTFNVNIPHGTPVFTSSPPMRQTPRFNVQNNKRLSVTQSDPNTTSSDNDTRLFTDDDSMDFQSDTAYDSLATRATASSHSGFRQPKIETIFDEPISDASNSHVPALEELMHRSTLNERAQDLPNNTPAWVENVGIGITGIDEEDNISTATPIREQPHKDLDEIDRTPLALRSRNELEPQDSSPSSILKRPVSPSRLPLIHYPDDMEVDKEVEHEGSIDWSPKSNNDKVQGANTFHSPNHLRFDVESMQDPDSTKRSSIFDWSEQQKTTPEASSGISPRPKTVHGKQSNDANRSRASGRKGPNAVHLRSQSVPVNREVMTDVEAPQSTAKYGTWGLGNKPVSEEWNDDFEFDDVEDVDLDLQPTNNHGPNPRDSIRSVKVPQSIIDRQASVHIQFGQVQEFMTLVEELKRLRLQGANLQLLDGQSRQLWEDADNIINLATINNEEEAPLRPPSPISSDIFGEDSPGSRRISVESSKRDSLTRRSVSNPATPQNGRPRGESLAQAKSFLQTIHQSRNGGDSSPAAPTTPQREKLPFDTQDLRDLVVRAQAITRALKELVRRAEGVTVSPQHTPQKSYDPSFRHIFSPPEASPCPPMRSKPGIPKSRSANSYLGGVVGRTSDEIPAPLRFTTVIEAN